MKAKAAFVLEVASIAIGSLFGSWFTPRWFLLLNLSWAVNWVVCLMICSDRME